MAEGKFSVDQSKFDSPICLDLLKEPVTIPCGHSYCMNCITDCWNQDEQRRVYSCPQCRQTFTTRPALNKNVMLAEMVENLKKTKFKIVAPAPNYAGPEDVECDVCTGKKYQAIKSCLLCLESYCEIHFERHEAFHTGKRHKITDASLRIQEMICPKHDKLLEVYCRTDQKSICLLCTMDEHKNHDTVSSSSERIKKEKQLEDTQRKLQQRIQEREKKFQQLKEAVETHKSSAQTAVEDSERIFTELIRFIERRRSEVTQMIRDREKTEVSRAEGLLKKLEQETEDLKRRNTELEQLSHTDDHIYFLQRFQHLVTPSESSNESIKDSSLLSFDDVQKSVSQLKEQLYSLCKKEEKKISERDQVKAPLTLPSLDLPPPTTIYSPPVLPPSPWSQNIAPPASPLLFVPPPSPPPISPHVLPPSLWSQNIAPPASPLLFVPPPSPPPISPPPPLQSQQFLPPLPPLLQHPLPPLPSPPLIPPLSKPFPLHQNFPPTSPSH